LPREQQRPLRFGQPPIVAQGFEQSLRQRDQARAVAFAVAYVDEPRLAINVAAFERQDLRDAQAGSIGGHDEHAAHEGLDFSEKKEGLQFADGGESSVGVARTRWPGHGG